MDGFYAVETFDVELAVEFAEGENLPIDLVNEVARVVLLSLRVEEEQSQPDVSAEDGQLALIVEGVPMSSTLIDVVAFG